MIMVGAGASTHLLLDSCTSPALQMTQSLGKTSDWCQSQPRSCKPLMSRSKPKSFL